MPPVSPAIRDLARRLAAAEATRHEPPSAGGGDAVRVTERLRESLAKLAGVAGFRSLLSRAVALAKAEAPSLNGVRVRPDGTLEGFGGGEDPEAGIMVVSHLLSLLVTFIGAPLTLGIVRNIWPDEAVTGTDLSGEGS